jgi:hypothetical protein
LIQICRDRRSSKHATLAEVTDDMTLYKGVRLAAIFEAIHSPGEKGGAESAFELLFIRTLIGIVAATLCIAPMTSSQAQTPAAVEPARFDQADRRSRVLLWSIQCAQSVSAARARREFGPVDSLGGMGQCVRVDGRTVGVFLDADTPYVSVKRFSAVDLGTHTRRTAPLDTAAVLAVVRAEQTTYARGAAAAFAEENRPFAPVVFRFDGDSIEVWLIPVSLVMGRPFTLGGERGYLFTPDGRTLVRETDASRDYRPFVVPDTGIVRITSRSKSVPSLSELVLANGLNAAGRNVAIEWPGGTSVLTGRGEQAVWVRLTPNP